MTDTMTTAYERDMMDEPASLLRFADAPLPEAFPRLDFGEFDRVILTGMGGSDCVAVPLELVLARAGIPVWRLPTGRLLEMPELISADSLLVVTSQSGRSGEVVALLERLHRRPRIIVGVTGDPGSPLAAAADHVILLRCGDEATVATKSYANSLAAHHRIAALVRGQHDGEAVADIRDAARSLQAHIERGTPAVDALAPGMLSGPRPRLALIGSGPDAATALAGAMVVKEAAKVAAEGYVCGAFRHGPLELAGPGLTAVLFGRGDADEASPHSLARDLLATGSTVVTIAPAPYGGSTHIAIPDSTELERLLHGIYAVQRLSIGLARAAGIVPGAFHYGRKITDQL